MEMGAAITILIFSQYKLPVSTSMCITGATVGVGLCNGTLKAVNWQRVGLLFFSWVVSLPPPVKRDHMLICSSDDDPNRRSHRWWSHGPRTQYPWLLDQSRHTVAGFSQSVNHSSMNCLEQRMRPYCHLDYKCTIITFLKSCYSRDMLSNVLFKTLAIHETLHCDVLYFDAEISSFVGHVVSPPV
jgi:hypothetical protein